MTRKMSLIFGILLAVGAFLGVLLVGSAVNPSPYQVVVAITEIEPGTTLDKQFFGIDPQVVSPQVAEEYVLSDELDKYVGATIVRSLVPGQPLMHRDIVAAGNPAAVHRIALALEDPNMTAMVLPVGKTTVPDEVKPGDRVAIVWSIGEANMLTGPSGWNTPGTTLSGATPITETGTASGAAGTAEAPVELPPDIAALLLGGSALATTEQKPAVEVSLPLAKTVLNIAEVISVRRDKEPNPAYTGEKGEKPYIEGDIIALEVALPRDEIEAVQFAISQGKYSIVVLSPNANPQELADASSLGVMWSDIVDYFQADRLRAMGALTVTGPVRPAGAANIYGPALRAMPASEASTTIIITGTEAITATDEVSQSTKQEMAAATPEPTATPAGPLPTATSVAEAEEAEATPQVTPTAEAGEAGATTKLPVSMPGFVLGIAAVLVVLVIAVLVVVFVIRALRKRAE